MLRIQSRPLCRMHFIHLVWWLLVHCDSESVDGEGGGRREKEGEEKGEDEGDKRGVRKGYYTQFYTI